MAGERSEAREYHTQQFHYLRKEVTFSDEATAVTVGTLPAGAIVLKSLSGVHVEEAFNDGGTDLIDVGYAAYTDSAGSAVTADPDAFATDIDVSATGYTELDEAAADFYVNANATGVKVTATYDGFNNDASAGKAHVIICYVPNNDR